MVYWRCGRGGLGDFLEQENGQTSLVRPKICMTYVVLQALMLDLRLPVFGCLSLGKNKNNYGTQLNVK